MKKILPIMLVLIVPFILGWTVYGPPLQTPTISGGMDVNLSADDNIFINGRINPRTITQGVMRFEHTPAITGTRPITLDVDANNFGDTRGITVTYIARGLNIGDTGHIYGTTIDTSNSTGGNIVVVSADKVGSGSINVVGMETKEGIDVISQTVATESNISQAWTYSGAAYTDRTTAFSSTGTNAQIFANQNDYVYIGQATVFRSIKVLLATAASGAGVKPTFEYSIGGGSWTAFVPSDGTNGFRVNGSVLWSSLSGWATDTVNSSSKYWIRIKRTQSGLATPPTESTITTVNGVIYQWDKNGDVGIKSIAINKNIGATFNNQTTSGGANTGTLTNSPVSGNPTAWLRVVINGTTKYIPAW